MADYVHIPVFTSWNYQSFGINTIAFEKSGD